MLGLCVHGKKVVTPPGGSREIHAGTLSDVGNGVVKAPHTRYRRMLHQEICSHRHRRGVGTRGLGKKRALGDGSVPVLM